MQNNRRKKRANEFVISIAMHLALFALLIWSSLYQTVEIMGGGEGEGDAMGAVMVDTGSAAQEWGRIQQQKKGQTDKQKKPEPVVEEKKPEPEPEPNQQEIAKQEEIKRQQEIQRQKELEKQKQQEIEKQKQQQELARQEALEKQKQAEEAKAKADAAKRKADQAALDDFMNGGDVGGGSASKGGNANKGGTQGSGAGLGAGDGGKVGDQYAGVIKREIQRRFLKDPSFAGKVCSIKIQLGRDGTILGYQRVSGPDDICTAALSAVARTKKVPAAPSDAIYEKYKAPTIDFDINAR